jgi:hypothetical protein
MAQKKGIQAQASQDAEKDPLAAAKITNPGPRTEMPGGHGKQKAFGFPSWPPGVRSQQMRETCG